MISSVQGLAEEITVGRIAVQQRIDLVIRIACKPGGYFQNFRSGSALALCFGDEHGVDLCEGHGKYFFVIHSYRSFL